MLAQQAGQFGYFWGLVVPAVMAGGSILITYLLYRHFAREVEQRHGRGKDIGVSFSLSKLCSRIIIGRNMRRL